MSQKKTLSIDDIRNLAKSTIQVAGKSMNVKQPLSPYYGYVPCVRQSVNRKGDPQRGLVRMELYHNNGWYFRVWPISAQGEDSIYRIKKDCVGFELNPTTTLSQDGSPDLAKLANGIIGLQGKALSMYRAQTDTQTDTKALSIVVSDSVVYLLSHSVYRGYTSQTEFVIDGKAFAQAVTEMKQIDAVQFDRKIIEYAKAHTDIFNRFKVRNIAPTTVIG